MRFDLIDLQLILNVIERGSITSGAERSHMALASASARITGMEQTLGTPLLERRSRGVVATPAGRVLADHAKLILAQIGRMKGDLADFASGLRSRVKVLANTAATSEFLPELLAEFLIQNPGVDIDLQSVPSHTVAELVAAGGGDLGIAASFGNTALLETLPFRTDHLAVILPPQHPMAGRKVLSFAETLTERFIALPAASALQLHLDQRAIQCGRHLEVRVRMSDFGALCRMVKRGAGIGVVPVSAAERYGMPAEQVIPLSDEWAVRDLVVCTKSYSTLSGPARRLCDFLTVKLPDRLGD